MFLIFATLRVEKCEKCKCKCRWNTDPSEIMSGKCESCGFNGDTCAAFIDIDGMEKCKKCKTLWNALDSEKMSGKCESCGFNGDWRLSRDI